MALERLCADFPEDVPTQYYLRQGFVHPAIPTQRVSSDLNPAQALLERFKPDIAAKEVVDEQTIALVEKRDPHTMTEAMLAVFGHDRPVITFADASPKARSVLLRWIHSFVEYATEPATIAEHDLDGGFLRIGTNIDHKTGDRGGLQGVRTLHPHCLCFSKTPTAPEVRKLDFSKPDHETLSVVDPLATLGPQIIADYYKAGALPKSIYNAFYAVSADNTDVMPFAFNLRLKDSWDSLLDPRTGDGLADLDFGLQRIYNDVRMAITGTDSKELSQPWQRPPILDFDQAKRNIDALPHLSSESREGLYRLAASLRTIPQPVMDRLRKARTAGAVTSAEKILAFAGLAYGMTFYSPGTIEAMRSDSNWKKPAYLAVQPALIRSSGVAGFNSDDKRELFKVVRSKARQLGPDNIATMRRFHRGYVQSLGSRALNGRATWQEQIPGASTADTSFLGHIV